MRTIAIFSLLLLLFACCGRRVRSEGTVYSPNGYPVPDIEVIMNEFGPTHNSTPYKSHTTTTDNNGHFTFKFSTAKNRSFAFSIFGDSGYCYKGMSGSRLNREEIKHIDLNLFK